MEPSTKMEMFHFLNQQLILASLMGIDIENMSEFSNWIEEYSEHYRELYNRNDGIVTVEMLNNSK